MSVAYACFGELHTSVLFAAFQVTFSGYLGICRGEETKLTPGWLLWICRAPGNLQKWIAAGLSSSHVLRGSGKVFPPSSAQPLQSREQGDSWGLSVLTHNPFSPAGWLFLVADAGLWLKGISSDCIVCSRGLSNAICIMHNHPCLAYLIWVENNSGYEICKRGSWLQHFKNKSAWWLFMLLFSFMQIGW